MTTVFDFLKSILFQFEPETAHRAAIFGLRALHASGFLSSQKEAGRISCLGLSFPNRIGLAAGFDKNAECVEALLALGFGFVEIGTVTPKPQAGNPKPRLFRLEEDEAIINRLGFNNHGAEVIFNRLKKLNTTRVVGVNLGKNRDTSNEAALRDYVSGMQTFWPAAHYFTINISSPNTIGLRDLQQKKYLRELLSGLKKEQKTILNQHQKYIPLVLKIAPDLTEAELMDVLSEFQDAQFDGIIVSNTTISRPSLLSNYKNETGGLSGRPLCALNTEIIKRVRKELPDSIPIIAAGGIMDVDSAREKIEAGAELVQIYTGFIYHGVSLLNTLVTTF